MKRILFALMIALALPTFMFAQTKPAASTPQGQSLILEFVDGNDLVVTIGDKVLKYGAGVNDGDVLPVGCSITTGASTTAELRIKPNGTILKLSKGTTFQVQAVATNSKDKNAFALVAGKVRAIAAKGGNYEFKSQTAVCGVRGTDFAFSVQPGAKEQLMVSKGLVQFQKTDSAGKILGDIPVAAGQFADAFASAFQAAAFTADQFVSEFQDLGFQKLQEMEVPGHQEEVAAAAAPAAAAAAPGANTGNVEVKPISAAGAASTLAQGASKLTKKDVESGFVKWLREVLGMELGSVTINGLTYSKAVIQPNFNLGRVKFGLYLPIIYTSDMFNPDDWYHPNGNDEWSFGIDKGWKEHPVDAAIDAVSDFALKVKFFEYGRQLEDPFFVKIGNVNDMTLGHGLIMRNYANDKEFPSIRRVGLNFGVDLKIIGIEALTNDLADLQNGIYGGRFYFRPIPGFKLAFGLSGVVDIAPFSQVKKSDGTIDTDVADTYGNPMLIGAGLDLDLPIIQTGLLSIRLFADAAAETEYLRGSLTPDVGDPITGLAVNLLYNDTGSFSFDNLNNWGAAAGVMGRLLMIDFRLEYRYYKGIFKPALFDSTYDKNRTSIAKTYASYIADPDSLTTAASVMGVYGEGGFSFLREKLSFNFGYMWPWNPDIKLSGDFKQYLVDQIKDTSDEFHAKLVIKKGPHPDLRCLRHSLL